MKKVSIIVPVYNVDKYIRNTLESILKQDYQNKEIIIIDDGSTDKSLEICNNILYERKNVKIIHQNNLGVSVARNKGLENATGDYIMFVDADDILERDMISTLVKIMDGKNADIAICGYKIKKDNKILEYYGTNVKETYNKNQAIDEFLNEEKMNTSLWNKMFKRDIVSNIKFDEKLKINEDKVFLLEAILKANKVEYVDKCEYIYIKRENSATSSIFSDRLFDVIKANKIIERKLENINYNNIAKVKINELINLTTLYRMLILSDAKEKFKNELKMIRKKIKNSKIHFENLNKVNNTKALEIFIIKYFTPFYSVIIRIGKRISFIKKIKNRRKKNEIRNSNISQSN